MSTNHPNGKGRIVTKPPPSGIEAREKTPRLRKPSSRLVVVEHVYHQPVDGQPVNVTPKFSKFLKTDEQPYGPRRVKIGPDSVPLESAWVGNGSQLVVENLEGTSLQVQPTAEEREQIALRIVEVWDEDGKEPLFLIPPGESLRARPGNLKRLRLRCASDSARIVYTVFPE